MPTTLAIDATVVGRPVVDTFAERNLPAHLLPVTITGGHKAHSEAGGRHVPKRILVSTLQVALQNQRLRIAAKLTEAATLQKDLQDFQLTFTEKPMTRMRGARARTMIWCWRWCSRYAHEHTHAQAIVVTMPGTKIHRSAGT